MDKLFLLYLIDKVKPKNMEELQCAVFLAQQLGVPFSYDDWREEEC